jgi:hypothetical protein
MKATSHAETGVTFCNNGTRTVAMNVKSTPGLAYSAAEVGKNYFAFVGLQ